MNVIKASNYALSHKSSNFKVILCGLCNFFMTETHNLTHNVWTEWTRHILTCVQPWSCVQRCVWVVSFIRQIGVRVCVRFRRYHISHALRVRTYVHACQPLELLPFFPLSVTTDRLDRLYPHGCRIFAACSQLGEQVGCGFVCRCVSLRDGASFKSPVCCLTFWETSSRPSTLGGWRLFDRSG